MAVSTKFAIGDVIYWCDRAMGEWIIYPRSCEICGIDVSRNKDNEPFVIYTVKVELLAGNCRTFTVNEEDCFAVYLECKQEVARRNGKCSEKEKERQHEG